MLDLLFSTALITRNKLKQYQQLQSKKFRQKYGLFVVEGIKSVAELLNSVYTVDCILCTADSDLYGLDTKDVAVHHISAVDLKKISNLKTSPEVLAIGIQRELDLPKSNWELAVDGLQDPGNLGTIIRIADWYGINTVYCSPDTVELYNPKVIQASMGSFTRVRMVYDELANSLQGKTIYAAMLSGQNVRELSAEQGVLLIGSESHGIHHATLEELDHQPITIPGNNETESLNAAVAAAVLCERLIPK